MGPRCVVALLMVQVVLLFDGAGCTTVWWWRGVLLCDVACCTTVWWLRGVLLFDIACFVLLFD